MNRIAALLLLALAAGMAWAATPDAGGEPVVTVEIKDGVVRVEANIPVPASARETWDVLTDFDNLPRYISALTSSKVLSRDGNVIRISQTGKAGVGPFSYTYQSIREITLTPFEKFDTRMIEGNMKSFSSTTRLESDAGATRIRYQSESVPDTSLPLGLARSAIESGTREHFKEMTTEISRRKSLAATR